MPASQAFVVRPLSPALGAEVLDIDLRQLDAPGAKKLLDVWHDNVVLLARNQTLSEPEQIVFGELFAGGGLSGGHNRQLESKNSGVAYVTNIGKVGDTPGILPDGEMHFHSDQCYREFPARGTMLYAMEVPSKGGQTLFANCYTAFETLHAFFDYRPVSLALG